MLTKEQKAELRGDLFKHLDGIATAPCAHALHEKGVIDFIIQNEKAKLSDLSKRFKANEGYLNVALRTLCAQGWLDQEILSNHEDVEYKVNQKSKIASSLFPLYSDVVLFMKFSQNFSKEHFETAPFSTVHELSKKHSTGFGLAPTDNKLELEIRAQIFKHIEGVMIGPTAVALGMGGMFHKYFMEVSFRPEEFHRDHENFRQLLDMFTYFGWFTSKNNTYRFTDKGLFYARRASAYGVTVSYIPTFRMVDELIFGNPKVLWEKPKESDELHVDRRMNVWGSGGAHTTYFKHIDDILIQLFNKPIHEQPKGIVDMGCGNGAFLEHVFSVIEQRTARGKMLEDHPLFLVGADYNKAALSVTRANLIQADIWAKVIWGDIGRPDILAKDLKEDYGIELEDLLNVRTFLDHNRVWEEVKEKSSAESKSKGAYAFRGNRIKNNDVEANLKMHLERWKPYVHKFGLLLIELHTIAPELTAKNLGKTAATAYDATHGFSDQYILEVDTFLETAAKSGLHHVPEHSFRFPNSELATVSINLLKG